MSVRIDERVARCLSILRGPEFAPLRAYWEKLHEEALNNLVEEPNDVRVRQLQGEAKQIKDLLNKIARSDELVKKIQTS